MHRDSKEADLYRVALIEGWLEEAGAPDITELPFDILTAFIAATNTILDSQRRAMVDPGEEIDA